MSCLPDGGKRIYCRVHSRATRPPSAMPQHLPKLPVTLEIPFAADGCASRIVSLGVEKNPVPSSRRICTNACGMLLETAIEIGGPPNIGWVRATAFASQDVNVIAYQLCSARFVTRPNLGNDRFVKRRTHFFLRAGDRRV